MSDSPELRTLNKCITQLATALQAGLDERLVCLLNSEGFLTDDTILNPVTSLTDTEKLKADDLVRCIVLRVQQDPGSYHMLLQWLKQSGDRYEPIVTILDREYARQVTPTQLGFPIKRPSIPVIRGNLQSGVSVPGYVKTVTSKKYFNPYVLGLLQAGYSYKRCEFYFIYVCKFCMRAHACHKKSFFGC